MFDFVDMEELERTAGTTGAFSGVEIDLLHETLLSWKSAPGDPYTVLELRDGKTLAAYAIIGRISGRESTYDIRYIVVDRDYRSTEGGRRLLEMIDDDLLHKFSYAVIRIEISGRKLESLGAVSFDDAGYKLIGHLPAYFGEGDDYFYFIRTVYRNPPNFFKPIHPTDHATASTGLVDSASKEKDEPPSPSPQS